MNKANQTQLSHSPPITTPLLSITDLQVRAFLSFVGILFGTGNPLYERIKKNVTSYFNNYMLKGGIFPGFPMRTFLASVITKYLTRRLDALSQAPLWVFGNFMNSLADPALTGTNLTSGKSMMFSNGIHPGFQSLRQWVFPRTCQYFQASPCKAKPQR